MAIKKILKNLFDSIRPQTVKHGGVILPAAHLRLCGDQFKDDDVFLQTAKDEGLRLKEEFQLDSKSRILDLGCGYGRLAIGLMQVNKNLRSYLGIDVNRKATDWCSKNLTPICSNFKFQHTDIRNERYNPDGSDAESPLNGLVPDDSIDVIYLYSVFSHMLVEDIRIYLSEFHRISSSGKIFLTMFVEEDVAEMVENPEGYLRDSWYGPLHCVRYNKDYIEEEFRKQGFSIERFEYAKETHGQSSYHLTKN